MNKTPVLHLVGSLHSVLKNQGKEMDRLMDNGTKNKLSVLSVRTVRLIGTELEHRMYKTQDRQAAAFKRPALV